MKNGLKQQEMQNYFEALRYCRRTRFQIKLRYLEKFVYLFSGNVICEVSEFKDIFDMRFQVKNTANSCQLRECLHTGLYSIGNTFYFVLFFFSSFFSIRTTFIPSTGNVEKYNPSINGREK